MDWEATGGKMAYEDATPLPKRFYDQTDKPARVTCFTCGKVDHRATDCRYKLKPMSKPVKPITCYSCGKEGHKSPRCPDKSSSKNPDKDSGKHLRVQALEPSNCRREDPTLPGKVNGKEIPFILDSAALITVVPEEFVSLKGSRCGENSEVSRGCAQSGQDC